MAKIERTKQGTSKRIRTVVKKQQLVFAGTPETIQAYPTFQGSTPSMPTPFTMIGKATPRQAGYKQTNSHE